MTFSTLLRAAALCATVAGIFFSRAFALSSLPVLDPIPPLVIIEALPTATPDKPLRADGHVSDLAGIQSVRWYLNGFLVGSPTPGAHGDVEIDVTLADGLNRLVLEATDGSGNTGRAEALISVDANAPKLVLDPSAPSIAVPAFTLSGTLTAPAGIASVQVLVDGAIAAYPRLDSGGAFAVTLPLAEGRHRVRIEAKSKPRTLLGLTLPGIPLAYEFPLEVDTVPPTVELAALPGLTTSQTLVLSGRADDATSGVREVFVEVNGVRMRDPSRSSSGHFTSTVWFTEGANTVRVTARDRAGNEGSASVDVTLDSVPPSVTVLHPSPGQVFGSAEQELSLEVLDRSATTVHVSGAEIALPAGGGRAHAPVHLPQDGAHAVRATVEDSAGNRRDVSVEVLRDSAAPVLLIDVANGAAFSALPGHSLPFSLQVADTTATTISTPAGTSSLPAGGGTLSGHAVLAEGRSTLSFSASDATGRTATVVRDVVYDLSPPEVSWSLAEGTVLRGVAEVMWESHDALTSVASSTLILGASSAPVRRLDDGRTWAGILETRALQDGSHALAITAADVVGNTVTTTRSVVVDNTPPTLAFSGLSEEQLVSGTMSVQVNAQDSTTGIAAIELHVNGLGIARCSASPCTGSYDTRALPDGVFTVTARVTDTAGNLREAAVRPVADNSAPERFLVAPAPFARVTGTTIVAVDVKAPSFGEVTCSVGSTSLGTSTQRSAEWPLDTTARLDGPAAVRCTARDAAGNSGIEEIELTVDNWVEQVSPARLSLNGGGGKGAGPDVELTLEGVNVALVPPWLASATLEVEGAAPVAVDVGSSSSTPTDLDGDGVPEVVVRTSRKLLQRAVQGAVDAGRTPTGVPVPLRLRIEGRIAAEVLVVVDPRSKRT